jgi:cardiolipin synthase
MRRWLPLIPNIISSMRILVSLPIAILLARHRYLATLWLFAAAGGSDIVDGWLAKRFDWRSELGGVLDPVADKLMLATVFVTLTALRAVPVWLTAAVIARDCIIVLGASSYRALLGPVEARPSMVSKLNTLCQIVFLLDIIGAQRFSWPPAWGVALGALVFVTVCVSGIDYVLVYGRMAAEQYAARQGGARAGGSSRA